MFNKVFKPFSKNHFDTVEARALVQLVITTKVVLKEIYNFESDIFDDDITIKIIGGHTPNEVALMVMDKVKHLKSQIPTLEELEEI